MEKVKRKKSRKIHSEILIKLPFEKFDITKSVYRATSPENKETPSGVIAQSKLEGNAIVFTVDSKSSFWDLISTVEDFFEKVDISFKTIQKIQK